MLVLLVLLVLIPACNFKGGSKATRGDSTAAVESTATQIARLAQETLSVLATQTAQAILPSSTPLPPTETPSETPPPTLTFTPLTPTATETSTPVPATATETPIPTTATAVVTFSQIYFQEGGTSAYLQKWIKPWEQHRYTVRAVGGQTMILSASSPNQDVYLDVRGLQNGQQLLWSSAKATYWTGKLPTTQDYLVTLTTNNPDTYYFLSVEIPANIYFDPGAYSDKIDGYIDVDSTFHPDVFTRVRYLAYAFAGQKMTVKLKSPNLDDLSVGIIGQTDGQAYIRYEVKNNGGTFVLPSTQGYYIDVYSVSGKSTAFSLKVTIK